MHEVKWIHICFSLHLLNSHPPKNTQVEVARVCYRACLLNRSRSNASPTLWCNGQRSGLWTATLNHSKSLYFLQGFHAARMSKGQWSKKFLQSAFHIWNTGFKCGSISVPWSLHRNHNSLAPVEKTSVTQSLTKLFQVKLEQLSTDPGTASTNSELESIYGHVADDSVGFNTDLH